MAVTANQRIRSRNPGSVIPAPVKAATRLYQGTMAFAVAATGYADLDDAAGANALLGIVKEEADNTAGANADVVAELYTTGEFELQGSGFTQAAVGDKIYATDNFTITTSSASATLIGRVTEFISATKLMVQIEVGTQA